MAIEKKSLTTKKTETPSKSTSTKSKVDTSKPAAGKVATPMAVPGVLKHKR